MRPKCRISGEDAELAAALYGGASLVLLCVAAGIAVSAEAAGCTWDEFSRPCPLTTPTFADQRASFGHVAAGHEPRNTAPWSPLLRTKSNPWTRTNNCQQGAAAIPWGLSDALPHGAGGGGSLVAGVSNGVSLNRVLKEGCFLVYLFICLAITFHFVVFCFPADLFF